MTENKRYEYWKDSDTAYDTKIKYGQYFRIIDKKDMVYLLNEQEERIKELESENKMLKVTIGRNEAYINRIKTIGKWSNTGDVND